MKKIGKLLTTLIFMFVSVSNATIQVQSSVDKTEVPYGETLNLTVSVISEDDFQSEEPRLSEVNGFNLLNKWDGYSTSNRMVTTPQGLVYQKQKRKDFNYTLTPKKEGQLSLSSVEVRVSGKIYKTQPILIKVLPSGSRVARNQNRPQFQQGFGHSNLPGLDEVDRMEEEFNKLLQQRDQSLRRPEPQFRTLPINPDEAFFIQVEADKTEAYEGEQVTVSWYVYTRGQIESFDRVKFPDLKGFWKEIIEEVPALQFTDEIVNGIPYKKALLASHALFPIKAGSARVDEFKIKSRVRLPVLGGGFMQGKPMEFTKISKAVPIQVKSLPTEGRPAEFTGAVGNFEIQSRIDGTDLIAHQPISLKIRIEGEGNAKAIDLPAIEWPKTLELYDTKSDSKFFKNGRSFKEFEVLVIPRSEGDVVIPSIKLGVFDPKQKKYIVKSTDPIPLKIAPNPQGSKGLVSNAAVDSVNSNKTVEKNVGKPQLMLPALMMNYESDRMGIYSMGWVVWLSLYCISGILLLFYAQKSLGWKRKRKTIKEQLQFKLAPLKDSLKNEDYRKVGSVITNAYYFVLGQSQSEGSEAVDFKRLMESAPSSLRRELGKDIESNFEIFQILGFAPESFVGDLKNKENLEKNVKEAQRILMRMLEIGVDESQNQNDEK